MKSFLLVTSSGRFDLIFPDDSSSNIGIELVIGSYESAAQLYHPYWGSLAVHIATCELERDTRRNAYQGNSLAITLVRVILNASSNINTTCYSALFRHQISTKHGESFGENPSIYHVLNPNTSEFKSNSNYNLHSYILVSEFKKLSGNFWYL